MTLSRKIGIAFALLFSGTVVFLIVKKTSGSVEVTTTPLGRKTLEITVAATATGTIKADTEVRVAAERTGRISKLLVEEGAIVKAGSLIAELDPEDAKLSLRMSLASYERAGYALDEMRAMLEPFRIEVETGIQKAGATLKEAEKRLLKLRDLKEKGFVSELELDAVERDCDISKAAYEAALSGRKGLLGKAEGVKAVEAALKEAFNALELSRLNYAYSFIKARISGVVSSRPVKLGETVLKGAPIAVLTEMDSLYIEAFIDEADVGKVKIGQEVHVSMDAYPEKTFGGKVYMISPVVLGGRHETRTFEVRTRLKEKGIVVKPGMSADVEIVVDRVEDALIIPSQAVIEKKGSQYVFIKEGRRAVMRKVKTGLSNWTYTEIVSGIREGEEAITNPDAPGLKEGVRIRAGGTDNRT
ncbi:MAG: efflux RND transporter periplasmic adaptor subunit [Thermodesulfovibrionales bacterium]|nr:efflux RND transporter periplasmic adaptor subunit [Thermodesulfovibrionales bacterium]